MAATQKPESSPGTAVARQDKKAETVERMTPEQRRELQRIRAENALTMTIMQESWGSKLSITQQRAFAEFIRKFHLDVTEVDNLGGRPYRNGYYYRRRIQELRTKGVVDWSAGEHIGPNKELDALAAMKPEHPDYDEELTVWAQGERRRRAMERIRWEVPPDATHAYVVRVKLKGDQNPLEGCDFITPTRLNSYNKIADPIGAAEPEKTVITRAWRRAGLLAAAEIPELKADEAAMNEGVAEIAEETEATIEAATQRDAAIEQRHPRQLMSAPDEPGSYEFQSQRAEQVRDVPAETPAPRSAGQRAAAEEAAKGDDPYAPAIPFAHQDVPKGTPIAKIATPALASAVKYARGEPKYEAFVEAADEELERRRVDDEAEG